MKKANLLITVLSPILLLGCIDGTIEKGDVTIDTGAGEDHGVEDLKAGIWVDGNGCEHWIIDDGIEGYLSPRWNSEGKPMCNTGKKPFTTYGFVRTQWFEESFEANQRAGNPSLDQQTSF